MVKALKRVYEWFAEDTLRTWIAHGLVAILFALIGGIVTLVLPNWSFEWGLRIGSMFAVLFYIHREIRDVRTHLRNDAPWRMIVWLQDGFGDLLGPLMVFVLILAFI